MKKGLLLIALLVWPSLGMADDLEDLEYETGEAAAADTTLKKPDLTDEQRAQAREQKKEAVQKIETIATKKPEDPEFQLKVGKSLASVDEAPRAIPYAERGLALAEKSGDPKLIRTALLTGSEVYYKAGKYELAGERAQRILKENPKDRDALALYMQVKGRTSAPSNAKTGGSTAAASSPASAGPAASPAPAATVPLSNTANLEAQRRIGLGRSSLALDPGAALKHFDAAVAADPKNASVRVERAKARLQISDFRGALEDADFAASLAPSLGAAYAARAEAKRGMGRPDAEVLAEYEQAAKLDGAFTESYQALLSKVAQPASAGGSQAAKPGSLGGSAPDGTRTMPPLAPGSKGFLVLIGLIAAAVVAAAGCFFYLKRRSSEEDSR